MHQIQKSANRFNQNDRYNRTGLRWESAEEVRREEVGPSMEAPVNERPRLHNGMVHQAIRLSSTVTITEPER